MMFGYFGTLHCFILAHRCLTFWLSQWRRLNGRRHCNWWHRRHLGIASVNLHSVSATGVIQCAEVAHVTNLWLWQSSERGQWTYCLHGLIRQGAFGGLRVGHGMTSNHFWNMHNICIDRHCWIASMFFFGLRKLWTLGVEFQCWGWIPCR